MRQRRRNAKLLKTTVPPGLCRCGCGEQAIAHLEDDAALLAAGRAAAQMLEVKKRSGGARKADAEQLLHTWHERAEPALDRRVHGLPKLVLGPPTPGWVSLFCDRAVSL